MSVSGQAPIGYGYDNANRLVQIGQGSSVVSFSCHADGRRTTLTLPNDIAMDAMNARAGLDS